MQIELAESDESILSVFDTITHLRTFDDASSFLRRIRELQQDGYLLVRVVADEHVVAAAGFRLGDKIPWGRHLYVDDLVTLPAERSKGFGSALLAWLKQYGKDAGCSQLHLDSAAHRKDTHRFYEREGLVAASLHFRCDL